jgi:type II secretory pathway component PulF
MSQVRPVLLSLLTAAVWLLFPLSFAVIGYATFVVPMIVERFQAQGIRELPIGDELLVDLSDFCKNRWFVVSPLLLVLAVGTSRFLATLRDRNT